MTKELGFILLILILFFSCSESEPLNTKVVNNKPIIYQEGNIKITLLKINDDRCPTNLDCVWQGNAEVEMRITNDNETMDFILNTAGYVNESASFPTSTSIFDLSIALLDLQPYPEDGIVYDLEDYTVSINVN